MRGKYSSKAYYHQERERKAEAPSSPVMQMPVPPRARTDSTTQKPKYKPLPHVIVMQKRHERCDGVEVWGPEAA